MQSINMARWEFNCFICGGDRQTVRRGVGGMGWGMGGDQKHTATFRRATLTLPAPLPLPRAPQPHH